MQLLIESLSGFDIALRQRAFYGCLIIIVTQFVLHSFFSTILLACIRATSLCLHAGRDQPFVNNYGVWTDEYSELGLEGTLDAKWDDALCYFGEGNEIRVGRR